MEPTSTSLISLAGEWACALERRNQAISETWQMRELPGRASLPGSLQAQGIGDPVHAETAWTGSIVSSAYFDSEDYAPFRSPNEIKVPYWLQPDCTYVGKAWYQKDIDIPNEWAGKRFVLELERPHWETRVWLDGKDLGCQNSLSTPHCYVFPQDTPCGSHRLAIRVDNSHIIDVGVNAHSVSDHAQGNWNGIIGKIQLVATEWTWVEHIHLESHTDGVTVHGTLGGREVHGTDIRLDVRGRDDRQTFDPVELKSSPEGRFDYFFPMPGADTWDEFSPVLYDLLLTLKNGETSRHTFGLRQVSTQGNCLLLNNHPVFLRGTLECCVFPKTGFPPTDRASWERLLQTAREYGLNHIRFHSWCPPKAAFVAADKLGIYLQVEAPIWPNQGASIGDGKTLDTWVYEETSRILSAYGNHPSFLLMAIGNEVDGCSRLRFLDDWVSHFQSADKRRLFTGSSGNPVSQGSSFQVVAGPCIQHWGDGLGSRINARPPETQADYADYVSAQKVPVISHEVGQWCAFPNFAEIPKYTGHLKPRNLEIFRHFLSTNGMAGQAREFLHASGMLQTLCYKEEIEALLRTKNVAGFQLLGLTDFPGQGTALVGVLDAFWESKGYVTPQEFRRFCQPTVLLARMAQRIFTNDEAFHAECEITHHGPTPMTNITVNWWTEDRNLHRHASGSWSIPHVEKGNGFLLGVISIPLEQLPTPSVHRLFLQIAGTDIINDWYFWVYPTSPSLSQGDILITTSLDHKSLAVLDKGGRVLLTIPPEQVRPDPKHGQLALGFSSIFWNTAWTLNQAPHTLGILCNPDHSAFAHFPTESHTNWQWWYLLSQATPMILNKLPGELQPIIQVIDDWFTCRKLALAFEAKCGNGKLLVTSIQLDGNCVGLQLKSSFLRHMQSPDFNPVVSLKASDIISLGKNTENLSEH